jgi:hypothetical protein
MRDLLFPSASVRLLSQIQNQGLWLPNTFELPANFVLTTQYLAIGFVVFAMKILYVQVKDY